MLPASDVTERSGKYVKFCQVCGSCWRQTGNKDKRIYCSDACKQRAYRLRKDPKCGSIVNLRKRGAATAAAKEWKTKRVACACCKQEFWAMGNNYGMTLYCSNACKQKAYRQRKLLPARNVTVVIAGKVVRVAE